VVRLGETTCGVWSLADHALWVDHRGKDKTYPTDGYGNFDFPLRTGKVTNGPMPLDRDDGWAGREWFLDMCNIRNTEVGPLKADLITAKILLRYGAAAGRAPKSRCEQERRYRFKDEPESKLRAVGAEIRVEHPGNLDKPYTDFRIVHLEGPDRVPSGEIGAIIRLRTSQGRATPVALVNIPIFAYMVKPPGKDHKGATEEDRKCEHDHFKAYFDLVGAAANRRCLLWKEAEGCQDPIGFRNPSEAGCVPCVICRS
jgi:hypothetical protein